MADETYRDRFSRLGLKLVIVGLFGLGLWLGLRVGPGLPLRLRMGVEVLLMSGLATVVAVTLELVWVLPGWLARKWALARHQVGLFLLAILIALLLVSFLRRLAKQGDSKSARAENWAIALGWWIPRKYRDDLVGDILEDCYEMRMLGCRERRVCVHVVYQWSIGVVTLLPTAIITAIVGAIRQIITPRM